LSDAEAAVTPEVEAAVVAVEEEVEDTEEMVMVLVLREKKAR